MNEAWQVVLTLVVLVVIAEGIALLALARAIGVLQLRLGPKAPALQTADGLAIGAAAEDLVGYDLRSGHNVILNVSKIGRWAVLFVSTSCASCRMLLQELGAAKGDSCFGATLVLVARGDAEANRPLQAAAPDLALLCDPLGTTHVAYGIDVSPFAYLIEEGHVTAKGIVNTREQLESLVESKLAYVPRSDSALVSVPFADVQKEVAR
jgi:hypothetical protein